MRAFLFYTSVWVVTVCVCVCVGGWVKSGGSPSPGLCLGRRVRTRPLAAQVDQLDARMDNAETVCGFYLTIAAVEEACTAEHIPMPLKQSLYRTAITRASQLFAAAIVDRVLFFVQKFLTVHKVADIDIITFRLALPLRHCDRSSANRRR